MRLLYRRVGVRGTTDVNSVFIYRLRGGAEVG